MMPRTEQIIDHVAQPSFCHAIGVDATHGDMLPCCLEPRHAGPHEYIGDDGLVLARWTSSHAQRNPALSPAENN